MELSESNTRASAAAASAAAAQWSDERGLRGRWAPDARAQAPHVPPGGDAVAPGPGPSAQARRAQPQPPCQRGPRSGG